MTPILLRVFFENDLDRISTLAATNFRNLGEKYERYLSKVISVLRNEYQPSEAYRDTELREIAAVADVVGHDSRAVMKRLKKACTGCGWCCSQTKRIVVREEDADRISHKLKQKRQELFTQEGKEWVIKKVHPCLWWNPRNGRCSIYNDRPHTCRSWPLGINDNDLNTVIPQSECNYAVVALAHKKVILLQALDTGTNPTAGI